MPKEMGELVRRKMIENDLLSIGMRIISDKYHIMIPIKEGVDHSDLLVLRKTFEIIDMDVDFLDQRPKSYKELIDIDHSLKKLLPSSYDILGDVCIIKLNRKLIPYREKIASSIIEVNKNITKVAIDNGVKGEFRVRDLDVIIGSDDLETMHLENNLRFKLDPSKVYFSPRLATERMRIATIVKNERVLDMFSGVGPFSLNIARHGTPREVIGIDINPSCHYYFKMNISLNGLDDNVTALMGDSSDIVPSLDRQDRVIMNLPHSSMEFISIALDVLHTGGYIHLYSVMDRSSILDTVDRIIDSGRSSGKKLEIIGSRDVHNYSPTQSMIALDIMVK
ncbi:MAG: class I SAM-dependent methyltransferase family protein [Thermoplasmata archaeon]|nr:class I SAM-dependent methyltransferase family protein [Thermoplasmata archaeon]